MLRPFSLGILIRLYNLQSTYSAVTLKACTAALGRCYRSVGHNQIFLSVRPAGSNVLPFSRNRIAVVMHGSSPTRPACSGGLGIGKGEANGAVRLGERGEITPRT